MTTFVDCDKELVKRIAPLHLSRASPSWLSTRTTFPFF